MPPPKDNKDVDADETPGTLINIELEQRYIYIYMFINTYIYDYINALYIYTFIYTYYILIYAYINVYVYWQITSRPHHFQPLSNNLYYIYPCYIYFYYIHHYYCHYYPCGPIYHIRLLLLLAVQWYDYHYTLRWLPRLLLPWLIRSLAHSPTYPLTQRTLMSDCHVVRVFAAVIVI